MGTTTLREKPRILVVEDHWLVAFHVEVLLEELGCEVIGPFSSLDDALLAAREDAPDAAFLDVFLDEQTCFPLAYVLEARGIPFAFATGCTAAMLPKHFREKPHIDKPYSRDALGECLHAFGLLGGKPGYRTATPRQDSCARQL